jgi:hypothetical protein
MALPQRAGSPQLSHRNGLDVKASIMRAMAPMRTEELVPWIHPVGRRKTRRRAPFSHPQLPGHVKHGNDCVLWGSREERPPVDARDCRKHWEGGLRTDDFPLLSSPTFPTSPHAPPSRPTIPLDSFMPPHTPLLAVEADAPSRRRWSGVKISSPSHLSSTTGRIRPPPHSRPAYPRRPATYALIGICSRPARVRGGACGDGCGGGELWRVEKGG